MNIERVNYWIALTANIGVLAGVIFLALQIQQSNRIATITAANEVYSNYAAVQQLYIENPHIVELVAEIRHIDDPKDIGEIERDLLEAYFKRLFNAWYPTSVSFENGLISEESFNSISDDVRTAAIRVGPAGRVVWRELNSEYDSIGDTHVMRLIQSALDELGTPR